MHLKTKVFCALNFALGFLLSSFITTRSQHHKILLKKTSYQNFLLLGCYNLITISIFLHDSEFICQIRQMIGNLRFKVNYAVSLEIHCCHSCVISSTICSSTLRMAQLSLFCRTGVGQHDGLEAAGG